MPADRPASGRISSPGGGKGALPSLLGGFATVGGLTLVSRILGFARDILVARYLGAGLAADCFFVAFKLPNFFRRLFAEGAFAAAFVPLFSKALGREPTAESRRAAKAFAEDTLSVLLAVLLLFTALAETAMPWAMVALAPGFVDQPDKFALAVELTRITFPYLLLISLVALFSGVLNAVGRFAIPASAPILLNLVLIASVLGFHDSELITARALAVGVSLAGIAQFLWLMAALRRAGFALRLPRPRLTPGVKRLLVIMMPVALGAGVMQVNLVFDIVLASFLPEGSLSWLFYADRLNQLPLGVIGIAVGTVLLPRLARSLSAGEDVEANQTHNRAIEFALLLTLPAAAALTILAPFLIRVLFEHGAFTAGDTAATARALVAFAAGLPAFVLVKVLAPGFFAREDTKTPVRFALAAMAVNVVLALGLIWPLAHVGLALATSLASWLNAGLLFAALLRRGHLALDSRLRRRLPRILAASGGMGLVLAAGLRWLPITGATSTAAEIGGLAAMVLLGLASYGLLAQVSGAAHWRDVAGALRRS